MHTLLGVRGTLSPGPSLWLSSEAGWDKWLWEQRPPRTLLVRGGDKCRAASPHSRGNSEALHVSQAPQHGSPVQLTHPALTSVPVSCPLSASRTRIKILVSGSASGETQDEPLPFINQDQSSLSEPRGSPGPPSCSLLAGNPISIGKSETGPTKGNKPEMDTDWAPGAGNALPIHALGLAHAGESQGGEGGQSHGQRAEVCVLDAPSRAGESC